MQLQKREYPYNFVPPPAEKEFVKHVWEWYQYDSDIPTLRLGMFHDHYTSHHFILDHLVDVSQYLYLRAYYLRSKMPFEESEFPLTEGRYPDCELEAAFENYIELQGSQEIAFVFDMKRHLTMNNMFFVDTFDYASNIFCEHLYYNFPIKGVW